MIRYLWDAILRVLFPPKCMLCGCLLDGQQTDLCPDCRTHAPFYPYSAAKPSPGKKRRMQFLDSLTAVWYYEGNVRRSLLRYKFYKATHLSEKYGRLLAMKLLQEGPAFDYLTWVPVSRLRRFRRGYDQTELLAEAIGRELNITPVRLLSKEHRPAQSGLKTPDERKANILGAYRVVSDICLEEKRILLLDDIFTTGATTNECAKMLRLAGAKEVHCASVAVAAKRK